MFGIIVTDSWIAYKFHMHPNHRHKRIGIKDYIRILCKDFLQNSEDATAISNGAFSLMDNATSTETNSVPSLINLDDERSFAGHSGTSLTASSNDGKLSKEQKIQLELVKHQLKKMDQKVCYSNTEQRKKR